MVCECQAAGSRTYLTKAEFPSAGLLAENPREIRLPFLHQGKSKEAFSQEIS